MVEPNFKHRYASADAALNALIALDVVRPPKKLKLPLISVGLVIATAAVFSLFLLKISEDKKVVKIEQETSQQKHKKVVEPAEPEIIKPKLEPLTEVKLSTHLVDSGWNIHNRVSIKRNKKFYFTVNLTGLPQGEYEGICKVFNSQGNLTVQGQSRLKTTADRLNTWCWYNFKKNDEPGNWRFEFYLDNQRVAQNSLEVLP
jgi:hypothetical protein